MGILFGWIWLLTGFAVFIGLLKPSLVGTSTRLRALVWYGVPCFASFVVFVVVLPPDKKPSDSEPTTTLTSAKLGSSEGDIQPAVSHDALTQTQETASAPPSPIAKRAGLGDLLTTIDAQWADWIRRVYDWGGGVERVRFDGVGGCEFHYTSGPSTSVAGIDGVFGAPRRAASIRGTTRDCFGSAPNIERFFLEVQDWMPPDALLQKAYDLERVIGGHLDKSQVYVFYSKTLASLPQIGAAYAYNNEPQVKVGMFWLKIHYFPDRNRVDIWDLILGTPGNKWLDEDGYTTRVNPDGSKWFKPGRDG